MQMMLGSPLHYFQFPNEASEILTFFAFAFIDLMPKLNFKKKQPIYFKHFNITYLNNF